MNLQMSIATQKLNCKSNCETIATQKPNCKPSYKTIAIQKPNCKPSCNLILVGVSFIGISLGVWGKC
jgi:hypothetical protein